MTTAASDQWQPIRLVHRTPARFRLRVPAAQRTPEHLEQLRQQLQSTPGVRRAEINRETGSILVHHDEGAVVEDLLEKAGLSEQVLLDAVPPRMRGMVRAEASTVATDATDAFFDLDARLSRATGGWLDLKMAIPLGLLTAATWRFIAEGGAFLSVPPYLLLYWAFDSFTKLHQPEIERQTVERRRVGHRGRLVGEHEGAAPADRDGVPPPAFGG
jgi:hypothetical protein